MCFCVAAVFLNPVKPAAAPSGAVICTPAAAVLLVEDLRWWQVGRQLSQYLLQQGQLVVELQTPVDT